MTKRICHTCAWWEQDELATGVCRFNAPTTHLEEAPWPMTGPMDWCRHWSRTTGWESSIPYNEDLEAAVELVLQRGLATGHADTFPQLMEEVLSQIPEPDKEEGQ